MSDLISAFTPTPARAQGSGQTSGRRAAFAAESQNENASKKEPKKSFAHRDLWQKLPKGEDSDPLPPGGGYKVPDQWQYYKNGLRKHFIQGQQEGNERFFEEVIYNRKKRWGLFLGISGLGLILTAASTPLRKLLHVGILAALLPIPIVNANRTIPKLGDAYKVARQGNPKKADRMFNSALREFNYSLFQGFLKPVSLALVLTTALGMPQSLAKPKTEWLKIGGYYLKKTANRFLKNRYALGKLPQEGLETRSLIETAICSPLEKLNRLKAPSLKPGKGISTVKEPTPRESTPGASTLGASTLGASTLGASTWTGWFSHQLSSRGWQHRYQPYPLLERFNLFLRKHGDKWEDWLRKWPLMDRLLGKKHGITANEQLPELSAASEANGYR